MEETICRNCRFWWPKGLAAEERQFRESWAAVLTSEFLAMFDGECHRHAPAARVMFKGAMPASKSQPDEMDEVAPVWPTTMDYDFCGEHQKLPWDTTP